MNTESRPIVMEVAKRLVTVIAASIGFLVTLMFTTFRGTPFIVSAQISLFSLLLCVVVSILTQMAVVEDALGSNPMITAFFVKTLQQSEGRWVINTQATFAIPGS